MKIVFMGTPEFAVPSLSSLIDAGYEIPLVVTQPDRKGNRNKIVESPVKLCATRNNIRVSQPFKIRKDEELISEIKNIQPDIIVVVAFGQILPQSILDIPKFGCINVHGSVLPKLRGASPMQESILIGLETTGITIMKMDAGLDTGDIISVETCPIDGSNIEELSDKLSNIGAKLLLDTIPTIFDGSAKYIKQNDDEATYTKLIKKEDGFTDFGEDSEIIERKIRAYSDWPTLYTYKDGLQYKIFKAEIVPNDNLCLDYGKVVEVARDSFVVSCKKGALRILELQPQGKKRMLAGDFLRGHKLSIGEKFGDK